MRDVNCTVNKFKIKSSFSNQYLNKQTLQAMFIQKYNIDVLTGTDTTQSMPVKSQPWYKESIGFALAVQFVSINEIMVLPPATVCTIDENAKANSGKTPSPENGQKTTSNFQALIVLIHLVIHGCWLKHHALVW